MGFVKGTKLALYAVVGALLARWFELGAAAAAEPALAPLFSFPPVDALLNEYAPALDWSVGVFLGVVAGDVLTYLRGEDVDIGRTAGILKGAVASFAGLLALANRRLIVDELARHWPEAADLLASYPGGAEAFSFAVGIWIGAVVADVTGV